MIISTVSEQDRDSSMLEKCEKHGPSRNRPCVSYEIAQRVDDERVFQFEIKKIFIIIPQKLGQPTIKDCFLNEKHYSEVDCYLHHSSHIEKGTYLDEQLKDWIARKKSEGYLFLIDRDYVRKESNDGFFIRSEKRKTKFMCPECLRVALAE